MSKIPQVSIIIPVYNRTHPLVRALESLKKQTFTDFEILVVDDHSEIDLKPYLEPFDLRYLKTSGKGVSAARNTGVRAAKSNLIAFLDSDDEWLPTKLEKQINYLSINSSISIVHTNEVWIREQKVIKQNSKQQKLGGRLFAEFTKQCLIASSSVLIRKSLFNQVGLFDESFPVCEDFDLWLRIAASYEIGFLEEELIIKHGGHEDQLSMKFHSMDLWRARALVKHLNNPDLTLIQQTALLESIKTKCEILLKGFQKHQNFENIHEVELYLERCAGTVIAK